MALFMGAVRVDLSHHCPATTRRVTRRDTRRGTHTTSRLDFGPQEPAALLRHAMGEEASPSGQNVPATQGTAELAPAGHANPGGHRTGGVLGAQSTPAGQGTIPQTEHCVRDSKDTAPAPRAVEFRAHTTLDCSRRTLRARVSDEEEQAPPARVRAALIAAVQEAGLGAPHKGHAEGVNLRVPVRRFPMIEGRLVKHSPDSVQASSEDVRASVSPGQSLPVNPVGGVMEAEQALDSDKAFVRSNKEVTNKAQARVLGPIRGEKMGVRNAAAGSPRDKYGRSYHHLISQINPWQAPFTASRNLPFTPMNAPYTCPGGLDCTSSNSCPSATVSCPSGWFCGSLVGRADSEAILKALATTSDTSTPLVPSTIQSQCPQGYFCPNSTQIITCPAGSWCPEGSVSPYPCDSLSICPGGSVYQVNFAAALLAVLYTIVVVAASCILRSQQQRAALKCRELQARGASRLVVAGETSLPLQQPTPPSLPGLSFSLQGFLLRIKGGREVGKALLSVSSLEIAGGTLTGILGPSGCGKTLLLQALRSLGAPSGCVLAGGSARALKGKTSDHSGGGGGGDGTPVALQRSDTGFVPQEDIFDRAFTPRELFTHSASLRFPMSTPQTILDGAVTSTLSELGLDGVADVVVGGITGGAANISGGQVKRVSIGMELVGRPSTLFLDEPTSGLDATAALALLRTLHTIVNTRGVTIFVSLAQPRSEAFECLDNLVLLQAGGRVAYAGPADKAVAFALSCCRTPTLDASAVGDGDAPPPSSSKGTTSLPPGCNPADFLLDLVAQMAPGMEEVDLAKEWEGKAASFSASSPSVTYLAASSPPPSSSPSSPLTTQVAPLLMHQHPSLPPPTPGFLSQFTLQLKRALVFRLRDAQSLTVFSLLHAFMALALSSGFSILTQKSYLKTLYGPMLPAFLPYLPPFLRPYAASNNLFDLGLQQLMFFISISCGTASGMSSIGVFGGLSRVFRREVEGGASPWALGLARMVGELFMVGWVAVVFSGVWMCLGHSGHWWNWVGVVAGISFASSGLGHISSLLFQPLAAATLVQVLLIITSVFSGVQPHLASVTPIPVVSWAWYLSLGTYGGQGAFATWAEYQKKQRGMDVGAAAFGFDISTVAASVGQLFALGTLWRGVALAILVTQQRVHSSK